MRKWMSERLKRRKKPAGDKTDKEGAKAQEPLQPRFYDDDSAAASAVPGETSEVESPSLLTRELEAQPSEPEASAEVEGASNTGEGASRSRAPRRRRGRGGRGSSRRPAVAVAPDAAGELASSAEAPVALSEPSVPEAGREVPVVAQPVPAPATPTHAAPSPARASKGTVVLAIGLPGSGKSSWFKRHSIHPLSSDLLRELLFDDAQEQRFQDLVFSNLRSMLKARLIARRPMNYVDATNLTAHDRHSWIKLAKDYGYDVQGVFFDVPLEICLERHQRRGRAVPEDIMRKMASKLKPPTFEEGFSKITVVRVKQKEAAAG
jgi:predicted kinase